MEVSILKGGNYVRRITWKMQKVITKADDLVGGDCDCVVIGTIDGTA